ncbi:MAG: KH domain-containing protein [Patescibacteria group bacterium]
MPDEATPATSSDPTQGPDKDFLETVVKAIVDNPDDVIIERSVDDLGVLIKLRVNEADMSKIVGKGGQTAKALRTLLRLVGSKFDLRVNLKILEPDGSEHRAEKSAAEEAEAPVEAPAKEKKPAKKEKKAEAAEPQEGDQAAGAFDNVI